MKKFLAFLLSILLILSTTSLIACANGDRYELTSVFGLGVSTDAYEYNYIDFDFDDNTYVLKNKAKANGIVTTQTGTFIENQFGGVIITNEKIPSNDYLLYYNETLLFSDNHNIFYVSATINGKKVSMIYTKN